MKKGLIIVTTASFAIGLLEALIYYNMGKSEDKGKFAFKMPPGQELAKTAGVVIITSIATAVVTSALEKGFQNKAVELAS